MAAPLDPAQLDHAIELYLRGESPQKIQATAGVSFTRLSRERVARGIPPRGHRVLPDDQLVRAYLSGASENALAQQYGVSRGAIAKRLFACGVERRGMSAAGILRAAAEADQPRKPRGVRARNPASDGERKRRANTIHEEARARRIPMLAKQRRALQRERVGAHDSPGEQFLHDALAERGLRTTPQRAIGHYNVDLAAVPVAMEVLGGGWHSFKARHAERTPYILDEGWNLVMVWDYEGRSALGPGAADYLVAFVEEMSRNPPATCQYRVITGQGEVLAARGREDDEFPLVPPPRGRLSRGA